MRRSFFSFAYDDVKNFRVNVVRNSWLMQYSDQTFVDGSIWENEKTKSPSQIKDLIESGLFNTSVTTVLVGTVTASRRWVKYEIVKSFERGNGILAIHINRIRGRDGLIKPRGLNPLDRLGFEISSNGKKIRFYELINGRWFSYDDLPEINNKKSNTLYFQDSWLSNDFGKFFKFSEFFETYCWNNHSGHQNFSTWLEDAIADAGR